VLAGMLNSAASQLASTPAIDDLSKAIGGIVEPEDVGVIITSHRFAGVPEFPEEYKGRVVAVPTTEDIEDATDLENDSGDSDGEDGTEDDDSGGDEDDAERALAEESSLAHKRASGGAPLLPFLPRGLRGEAEGRAEEMARTLLSGDSGLARARAATAAAEHFDSPPNLFSTEDGELLDPIYAMGLDDPLPSRVLYARTHGLPLLPSSMELENEMAAEDSEEDSRISGPWGDDVHKLPRGILEEFSQPLEFGSVKKGLRNGISALKDAKYTQMSNFHEAAMTPAERTINAKRKALRAVVEAPIPVITRPLWPIYSMIVGADIVRLVTSGGVLDSMRCMVVVGNGMGGVGVGMAKHKDAFAATKLALEKAQRDMVHIPSRNGCLYHDLAGKKNGVRVFIRALPASGEVLKGAPTVVDILELAGIKAASAKVYGNHRRSPYVVTQALFSAFNSIQSPEQEAVKRGMRIVQHTADRLNPNVAYPFSTPGPRHAHNYTVRS